MTGIILRLQQELPERVPVTDYIAGIIDADGSIAIELLRGRARINFVAMIRIGMTHKETIERIGKTLGITVTQRKYRKREPVGICYYVQVRRKAHVEELLQDLLPHLITKRRQAELVLEFLKLKRQGNRQTLHKQFEIYWKVRKLNPKGKSLRSLNKSKLREEVLRVQANTQSRQP